jgi:hypothetical protein
MRCNALRVLTPYAPTPHADFTSGGLDRKGGERKQLSRFDGRLPVTSQSRIIHTTIGSLTQSETLGCFYKFEGQSKTRRERNSAHCMILI